MQISLGLGFIGITSDLVSLIRCMLVNATFGPETYQESSAALSEGALVTAPPEGTPDLPKVRGWARTFMILLSIASVMAFWLGIYPTKDYSGFFDDQKKTNLIAKFRFVLCLIHPFFLCSAFNTSFAE